MTTHPKVSDIAKLTPEEQAEFAQRREDEHHRQDHERIAAAINLVNLCRLHANRPAMTDNDSIQLAIILSACDVVMHPDTKRAVPPGFMAGSSRAGTFGVTAVQEALNALTGNVIAMTPTKEVSEDDTQSQPRP